MHKEHDKKKEEDKEESQKPVENSKKKEKTFWENLLKTFSLKKDQEKLKEIMEDVREGIPFHGTNLWVLIFAIFIASIGLNINSPAVIIGAMLISPLMGPIIGMGVSLAIYDIPLLKKAIGNYLFAVTVSLVTSLLYFLISPISIAHSEILARTSPTIYDVFIALFGGLAGSIALASTKKWNVVPGVAIATALMPPLCTAGYGLATMNFHYFLGAFYLFIINTVFITTSAFLVARFLRFPYKKSVDEDDKKSSKRLVFFVVILTMLPSVYFGYDIVQQTQFSERANEFIKNESHIEGDYLLRKKIDAKNQSIELIYGGKPVNQEQIESLKNRLSIYEISNAKLEIKQGFASLYKEKNTAKSTDTSKELEELSKALENIEKVDWENEKLQKSINDEGKLLYPAIENIVLLQGKTYSGSGEILQDFWYILTGTGILQDEKIAVENWLKVRTKQENMKVFFEVKE